MEGKCQISFIGADIIKKVQAFSSSIHQLNPSAANTLLLDGHFLRFCDNLFWSGSNIEEIVGTCYIISSSLQLTIRCLRNFSSNIPFPSLPPLFGVENILK